MVYGVDQPKKDKRKKTRNSRQEGGLRACKAMQEMGGDRAWRGRSQGRGQEGKEAWIEA